jgi:hypothetical protein
MSDFVTGVGTGSTNLDFWTVQEQIFHLVEPKKLKIPAKF